MDETRVALSPGVTQGLRLKALTVSFFAALVFGVIVVAGAFVVRYVGTMVLQVCLLVVLLVLVTRRKAGAEF